jgi:hypothetical protein
MRKITILTWAVVLLVVMNVATIATVIYHNYNERRQLEDVAINTGTGSNPLNGKFFRQQLGFDENQMGVFRDANSDFRPAAFKITSAIDSLKGEMFTALQQSAPDSMLLDKLSEEIGRLHSSLKKETCQFYLQLKKVCTAQQLTQLDEAFRPIFINEAITTPFNPRQRKDWGKQHLNN